MLKELGFSLESGTSNDATKRKYRDCQCFKERMWERIGRNTDGAFLKTITDEESKRMGIGVEYDNGMIEAREFALKAASIAGEVWGDIYKENAAGVHIVKRRSL